MKIVNKSITEVINTEYLEYAMYVLENRAIPSAIDGLKMVHRKLLYSMLTEHSGKKVKIADLSGISKLGYHHGESSAASAAITLTADWNNNCPIFTGHGNFGSRLVQEAAAPRYIFASLSPEFKKIFIDNEVTTPSLNEESPEPRHYLPIIPWVLVNSISGIAVGFATDILPRSIKDITTETLRCIRNPEKFLLKNAPIAPTFPHFRGSVTQENEGGSKWSTRGIIEYIGKSRFNISELPVGYDREAFVILLNTMIDKELIKDYDDNCSEAGFGFTVKVSLNQKEEIEKGPLKYFKLIKQHSENLTTLGVDGKLKIFGSVAELIHYFCQYRVSKFDDKIKYEIDKITSEIEHLTHKKQFISDVVDDEIPLRKASKQDLLDYISKWITTNEYGKDFIRIPLYECTVDQLVALTDKIYTLENQLKVVSKETGEKRFENSLVTLKV